MIRLVTYNIQYGVGKDGRFDLDRTAEAVRGADVIALQEVERFWKRTNRADQPAELGARLADYYWVYGANLNMDASMRDEGGRLINRRRQFGTMILSRRPIISSRNFPLPKFGALRQPGIHQGALETVIDVDGRALRFYSIHLTHVAAAPRADQVRAILDIHARAPGEGGAWSGSDSNHRDGWVEGDPPPMPREAVLMGDFNFEPDAAEYDLICGPSSAKYGRLTGLEGFVDAWVAAGRDERDGATAGERRIDYVFASAALNAAVVDARVDAAAAASDHRPLWATLDLAKL